MTQHIASMTGFGRASGITDGLSWSWELRSVNGRGLDVKLRLPHGFDLLEPPLRETAAASLGRGNVNAVLTVQRDERRSIGIDHALLDRVLELALATAARIPGARPPDAARLLGLPGVLRAAAGDAEAVTAAQLDAVRAGFAMALQALALARQEEGSRLERLLASDLDEIARLHRQAEAEAAEQAAAHRERLLSSIRALLAEFPSLPEERIAQEIAVLSSRSDVREELDRLASHVDAARALLGDGARIGRRFDFLVQEFVRETNTLCSKSTLVSLTTTGLQLKAVIEQMREQVQNVE